MNTRLVVLVALAFGHLVVADNVAPVEKSRSAAPSVGQKVIANIINVVRNGFKASPHIVGGAPVVPHSYPHQVLLSFKNEDQSGSCGGSLITPEWVLTAAHCVKKSKKILVLLGYHDITEREAGTQEIRVQDGSAQFFDPDTDSHDIALLRLSRPAKLNERVQTIRLPPLSMRGDESLLNTQVVMTGWGHYSDRIDETSPVLREAKSHVISNTFCDSVFVQTGSPNTQLCVDSSQAQGVCHGDSGGPLITTEADGQPTIIGVTSYGNPDGCEEEYPTVFTRVDAYLEWISETTGLAIRQN